MNVKVHVETQYGIPSRSWDEWTLTATMRSDGGFYDWLQAERGGERLDIDDFKRLAPDVDLVKLEDEAVEAFIESQAEFDAPWMLRADYARERSKERAIERSRR